MTRHGLVSAIEGRREARLSDLPSATCSAVTRVALGVLLCWPALMCVSHAGSDGFSFVVLGDCQFATNSSTSGVPERLAVPKIVVRLKPNFVLHTGDLMDHGYDRDAYGRFVEYYRDLLAAAPFFPTMGNHDAARGGIFNYRTYLTEQLKDWNPQVGGASYERHCQLWFGDDPTPYAQSFKDPVRAKFRPDVPTGVSFKTFYAFRYQNALLLSLEQGTRWWANTPRSWIRKHLRAARRGKEIDHIFVVMHHPMYSSTMRENPPNPKSPSSGECIAPVRALYEPLFREYDVTMVFSGHAHLYDRFYVPDDDRPTRIEPLPRTYPHDGTGIHYLVTGGAGGPLNRGNWRRERSFDFFQRRVCAYHVTEVKVQDRQGEVSVHLVRGSGSAPEHEVFDTLSLRPPGPHFSQTGDVR